MNWLEIGCPYCPTVLTVPRTAAGRDVRCPECGKSYIVPEPKHAQSAAYEVTTPLPMLPATMEEVEFEEFAAAAVATPAAAMAPVPAAMPQAAPASPPAPAALQREPLSPQPTAHPTPKLAPPTVDSAPVVAAQSASPSYASASSLPSAPSNDVPAAAPVAPRVRRRSTADDLMYPELEKDSPLPEVEILPPPGQHSHVKKPTTSQPATVAPANDSAPSPSYDPYDTRTPASGHSPHGPPLPRSAAEEAAAMEEVQQRIRRHQIKALINLAAFVVGILVMTAFAFIVVRFSRPS